MGRALCFAMIVLGGIVCLWSFLPAERLTHTLELAPDQMSIATLDPALQQGLQRPQQAILQVPARLLIGQSGDIRLTFAPAAGAPKPAEMADIYASHTIQVEARLELPGAELLTSDRQGRSLPAGQTVTFAWTITPGNVRSLQGTAWLWLHYYPVDGSPATEILISAQPVKLSVVPIPIVGVRLAALAILVASAARLVSLRFRRKS